MIRIKDFQKILLKKNIDYAIFLNSDENKRDKAIFYFSGVDPEFACLIIPKKGEPSLIVASLDLELSKKESRIKDIVLLDKNFLTQLKKILKNAKTIGVNFKIFTLNEERLIKKYLKNMKLTDISREIIELRIQKTDEEIKKIKKACKITDDIFSKIIKNFNFKSEKEIEEFIEKETRKKGCRSAFSPDIAAGVNSSMPHYKDNDKKLQKGFLIIDFGVNYKGYNSDMTRTIYIGTPEKCEEKEYYKVLKAQTDAIKQLKAFSDFRKIDKKARKVLGKPFIHSIGHGLGIDIHEKLSADKKKIILKENSVLTIEPGVYYPKKFGIRIEDDILVTKKGYEILTKSRKELIVIK